MSLEASVSAANPEQEDLPLFYCHRCAHQFLKSQDSVFECPRCRQGFIEEVSEDFQPRRGEILRASAQSSIFNLHFPQENNAMEEELHELDDRRRRHRNRDRIRTVLNRRGASRSRSPLVNLVLESADGNANFRIGLSARAAASNRLLTVAIDDIMDTFINSSSPREPAMTEEQLQGIPKVTITEEQVRNELMCSICFEDFQTNESEIRKLQCEHLFHEKCIFPWLKNNATCPVCRTELADSREPAAHESNETDELVSMIRAIRDYQTSRIFGNFPSTSRAGLSNLRTGPSTSRTGPSTRSQNNDRNGAAAATAEQQPPAHNRRIFQQARRSQSARAAAPPPAQSNTVHIPAHDAERPISSRTRHANTRAGSPAPPAMTYASTSYRPARRRRTESSAASSSLRRMPNYLNMREEAVRDGDFRPVHVPIVRMPRRWRPYQVTIGDESDTLSSSPDTISSASASPDTPASHSNDSLVSQPSPSEETRFLRRPREN